MADVPKRPMPRSAQSAGGAPRPAANPARPPVSAKPGSVPASRSGAVPPRPAPAPASPAAPRTPAAARPSAPQRPIVPPVRPSAPVSRTTVLLPTMQRGQPPKKPVIDADPGLIDEESLLDDGDYPVEEVVRPAARPSARAVPPPSPSRAPAPVPAPAPVSTRRPAPAPVEEDMLPEEDVQEQPAARPAPARQSSRDAAPQRGSRSVVPPAGAGAPETHSRSSRKVTQRVSRANAPVPQPIPRKYLIGAGAGVVLLLAAVIGWNPFWRWSYGSTLKNSSASVDARKAAAGRLVQNYLKDSLYYFDGVSETSDPGRREASAYGLELLGTARNFGTQPIEHLAGALPKNDEPGKVLLIQTIDRIMRDLARNKPPSDEESKCDAERARKAAAALISETEPAVPQAARAEAVKALRELRVPGVCLQMLKLARTEKGELRDLARNGVNSTALPDAVGGLLKAMADAGDPELAQAARSAFVVVRESAKSTELTPLVSDPAPGVRREIISALGSRGGDLEAARGITLALGDALPELRILALKAVPKTGLNPASRMTQLLGALVTDASEGVRIQNAETLGELRDDDSKKVILSAFGKNLEGATLAAYIKALGKRSYGKDIQAVAFLMPLLDSQPQAEKCIRDALVRLTLNNVPGREAVRSQWSAQRWKEWYDKIVKREKVRSGALAALAKCDTQRHADKSEYPRLGRETNKALEELEDCMTNRCDPDDSEDKPLIEAEMFKYGMMKSLFMKSQALEGTH